MFRKSSFSVVSALVAACAASAWTPSAQACTQELCVAPIRLAPGGVLPGNMIYFQVLSENPGRLVLRTAEGEPVAASIRTIGNDRVFAPDAPVADGTQLVLEYNLDCRGLADNTTLSQFEFRAGVHTAIELRPGELVVEEEGVAEPGRDGERAFVRLRYFEPDAGDAYGLMSHGFTVDGVPVWLTEVDGVQLVEVTTRCRPLTPSPQINTCGILDEVPAGVHTVVATTTIVGATTQPEPVVTKVEVACPNADEDDDAPDHDARDATGDGADAAELLPIDDAIDTTGLATTNDLSGDVTPAGGTAPEASSGCALSHPRSSAAGAALGALALALVARRRRAER